MYRITTNGNRALWDPSAGITLIEPKLELKLNSAGSLTFKIDPTHHLYGTLGKYTSYIDITHDGKWLWSGRVLNTTTDMNNIITVEAEGEQAYLNDIIQRPKEYHNISIRNYLIDVVENIYNPQVPIERRFKIGIVTVTDSNDSIYKISNYDNTWDLLNDRLLGTFGGYFRIRHENGVKYIDYLKDFTGISTQHIAYGDNLLDLVLSVRGEDFATAVIPLGEQDPDTDTRLTIASVNGGRDYVQDDELVAEYGLILKVVEHDDVTLPSNLLTKGLKDLAQCNVFNGVIETRAIDLNIIDSSVESFRLGDLVTMDSRPHGLEVELLLREIKLPFDNPQNLEFILGTEFKTLTDSKLHADKVINEIKADYVTNQQLQNTVNSEVSKAVKTVLVEYRLSDSPTELTGGEWSPTAPEWTAGKYMWQRTKTVYMDGTYSVSDPTCIAGAAGADGTQLYTWMKYADSPTSGMSENPAGKAYIGLAYNKETPEESINYSDYTWSLIKGEDGEAAKSVKLVSSVRSFKSIDGGTTFTPDESEITALCQNTQLSRWEYSTDGAIFHELDPSLVTTSGNTVKVSKNSEIFNSGTTVTIRALARDPSLPPYRVGVLEGDLVQFSDGESRMLITSDSNGIITRCGRNLLNYNQADFAGTDIYLPPGDYSTSGESDAGTTQLNIQFTYADGTKSDHAILNSGVNKSSRTFHFTQSIIRISRIYEIASTGEARTNIRLQLEPGTTTHAYEPYTGDTYTLEAGLAVPVLDGMNSVFRNSSGSLHIEYRKAPEADSLPSDILSPTENWPADTPYQDSLTLTKISDGKGITSLTAEYAISESKTEVPTEGWTTESPVWIPGHYLWSRSKIEYTDGSTDYTTPYCDSSWEAANIVQEAVEKNTSAIEQLPTSILAEVSREYSKISSVDYIQALIDGTACKWAGTGIPTVNANTGMYLAVPRILPFTLRLWGNWNEGETYSGHIGDIYTDNATGKKYVFRTTEGEDGPVFIWEYLEENAYLYDVARLNMKSDSIALSVNKLSSDIGRQSAEIVMMSDRITSKVTKGSVVSEINQTSEEIRLTGNRVVIQSTHFSVTADGHITATGGTIGGFAISSAYLANNTNRLNYLGETGVIPADYPDECVYVGIDGISLGKKFKVTSDGVLYANQFTSEGAFAGVSGIPGGDAGTVTATMNNANFKFKFNGTDKGGIYYGYKKIKSANYVGVTVDADMAEFNTLHCKTNLYYRNQYIDIVNGYLKVI